MKEIEILPFSQDLKKGILNIESECFSTRILGGDFDGCLSYSWFYGFCACERSEVLGYVCFNLISDFAEIIDIAVTKNARRSGIASRLIEYMLSVCRENQVKMVALEVKSDNISAISLYKKFGFVCDRVIKNYYKDPLCDAVSMHLSLL